MTRYEKFEYLRDKGWTYNPETGEVFNSKGNVCNNLCNGYVRCNISIYQKGKRSKGYFLYGHHFAWFWVNGNVDVDEIDHINQNKLDNRICNLRNVTHQANMWNSKGKGYTYHKHSKKYYAKIRLNNKVISLGYYDTPEEARQAYLNAKQKYHVI
tara:strand:- start:528 stop:992 length:465 start_codon:yes stop_codon:yes gene_type:complete